MSENFQLVTVKQAAPKFGKSEQGLYRDIREGLFPWPNAVVRFGEKQIRINLAVIEKAMSAQNAAEQRAAA